MADKKMAKSESIDQMLERIRRAFRAQRDAAEALLPSEERSYSYVTEIFPTYVVTECNSEFCAVPFSMNADGDFVFDFSKKTKVKRTWIAKAVLTIGQPERLRALVKAMVKQPGKRGGKFMRTKTGAVKYLGAKKAPNAATLEAQRQSKVGSLGEKAHHASLEAAREKTSKAHFAARAAHSMAAKHALRYGRQARDADAREWAEERYAHHSRHADRHDEIAHSKMKQEGG